MKRKTNRTGKTNKPNQWDRCQTPFYAVDPLLPYLKSDRLIWESAAGEDRHIVKKLTSEGFDVHGTDLLNGYNFFNYEPAFWDVQVTNPPYSQNIKYPWIKRSFELNKPWALLMPLETWGAWKAQKLFIKYGIEVILLSKRINFCMPNKGYNGKGSHFPVAWFTWGLDIGQPVTYANIVYYPDNQILPGKEVMSLERIKSPAA